MNRNALWALLATSGLLLPHWIDEAQSPPALPMDGGPHALPAVLAPLGSLIALLFLPLFSRIRSEDVLVHEARQRILAHVRAQPGLGLHELKERAGMGWGTTVYHVNRLEAAGHLLSLDAGRQRALFLPDHDPDERDVLRFLVTDSRRRLLLFLINNPGSTQQELARAATISAPLAHRYLGQLEAEALVHSQRSWRIRRYYPTERLSRQVTILEQREKSEPPTRPTGPSPQRPALSLTGTSAR